LAPLTPGDTRYLIAAFLKYGNEKDVHEQVIAPLMLEHDATNEATTRLHMMTEPELKKFAQKYNLDRNVPPGRQDFDEIGRILREMKDNGANVAFKLPGEEASCCDMLADSAKEHLHKNDLFIFVQSRDQARLLETFPGCIGTDGTHRTMSYRNAKLITVNITSYGQAETKERGFVVALCITTSEREDIHLAIIEQIRAAQRADWVPKLLMSDMAFAAFNAWVKVFRELRWLFCVFHVWQAWLKKLRQTSRPSGMTQADFSHLRGHLIREIKDLISPPAGTTLTWDEFNERAEVVRLLMWAFGLTELATSWEQYLAKKDRWAPPARREAVDQAFGKGSPLPMLAVSNNSVERFFGVLKYILLGGKTALTISALLRVWIIYGARIRINAVKAGISLAHLQGGSSPFDATSDLATEAANIFEEVIDAEEAREQEMDEEEINEQPDTQLNEQAEGQFEAEDGENHDGNQVSDHSGHIVQRFVARSPEERATEGLLESLDALDEVIVQIREWAINSTQGFASEKHMLVSQIGKLLTTGRVALALSNDAVTEALGPATIQPLIKQRNNYGPVSKDVAEAAVVALAKSKRDRKQMSAELRAKIEAESFRDFSKALMVDEVAFAAKVKAAQEDASDSDYTVLRAWLKKNSAKRLYGLGKYILGITTTFPSWKKERLVDAIVSEIKSRFALSEADQAFAGDFGVLMKDTEDLFKNDVICLRVNAVDNLGDPCVVLCDHVEAWVVRNVKAERVVVDISCVQWGYLSEQRRDWKDLQIQS